ncbi:hypothetical protein LCGC14_1619340 [marine sediment metagenome]|uniref:CAAX prenyl protease 2/Lysostaphin resistance protein A-like domain-containing protein n=1 Tax=marine sediment metagenome TaxID=412755 RepID=A0A0F9I608_9ZZZZ|nr:MAG: CAAX amino terminal protease self- immunity [Candidatus Lokiarchaeum sp. GC14_75]HEC37274.1 CPBP family intramembrane metalloprotease [bacterium]
MNKFYIISILSVFLAIPIFFGVFTENFFAQKLDLLIVSPFVLGFFSLLIGGTILNKFILTEGDFEIMKTHPVINAFNQKNWVVLWIFFPLTMIMEELIFRYYLIGFLVAILQYKIGISVIVSATLFSLYHTHTWFSYKSLKILFINLSFTLLLGFFLGFTFFTLGIIFCIVVHYFLALYLWYSIFRNIKKSGIY